MDVTYYDCTDDKFPKEIVNKGSNYNIDDCIMVRTTNSFPFGKIVNIPVNGNDVILGDSFITGRCITDMLRKKYPDMGFSKDKIEAFFKELDNYKVLCKNYRSTVHFSINGLVGSHAYGDFSNRRFIIFEPLKYHIKDNFLLSLGVNDTYFGNDIELSSDACILMPEDVYREIYDNEDYTNTLRFMKVYVYNGNEQIAVSKVLNNLGYDSFLVNSNGYVNGFNNDTGANEMYRFIASLRKKNKIDYVSHFNSLYNANDIEVTNRKSIDDDIKHFFYILDRAKDEGILDNEVIDKVKVAYEKDKYNEIDYTNLNYRYVDLKKCDSTLLRIVPLLLESIGLEKIKKYTKEYNDNYLNKIKDNKRKNSK